MCGVNCKPDADGPWRHAAFTLLEVIIALAILSMITGTIFAIVGGSTQATIEIEAIQKENRRLKAFVEELRRTFATMPANGQIEVRVIEQDPLLQELVIRNVPDAFLFGEKPVRNRQEITLALRRPELPPGLVAAGAARQPSSTGEVPGSEDTEMQKQQPFYLALTTPDFFLKKDAKTGVDLVPDANPMVVRDEKGRYWMPLLPDLAGLQWHVWDAGKKRWIDKAGASKPQRLQLSIFPMGKTTPHVIIFDLM